MHSLSEEDWKIEPRSISSRRSFVGVHDVADYAQSQHQPWRNSPKKGCTSRICVAPLDPAVE